ncbi:MAG: DUF6477 family protein [Rhodobacter sp.]|nr:DUF6477 family protein [Rhodobacter sp.]
MADPISLVQTLRRPRLLLQAARHGLSGYNRDRTLKRLVRGPALPGPKGAVSTLLTVEATLEDARKMGDASYNVSRHVEVLIALLAETTLLAKPKLRT